MYRLVHCSLLLETPERDHWLFSQRAAQARFSFNKAYQVLRIEGESRRYFFIEGGKGDYLVKGTYGAPMGRVRMRRDGESGILLAGGRLFRFFFHPFQLSLHDERMRLHVLATIPDLEPMSLPARIALTYALFDWSARSRDRSPEADTALNG